MAGLAGIIAEQGQDCGHLLNAMTTSMMPDANFISHTRVVPEMGLYIGWTASDNSVSAPRLFSNERQDIVLVLSGECFMHPQTSGRNGGNGLINLYEEQGDNCFKIPDGAFSGLLIDKRENRAFLFNDRYGVDRVYWYEDNGALYFASEAKALLQILPELRSFDDEGVAQFLTFGCTLGTRTLFKGIQTLPGGSLWRLEDGKCHKTIYFSSDVWEKQAPLSISDFENEFQKIFTRALPRYFESDSRIGVSLTAGLDTRMLMACRPQAAAELVTYTFDGPMGRTADSRLAAKVASSLGLEHHVLRLGSDFFADFGSHVDRTVNATDGYFGVTGAHEIYLNGLARQLAPIRLTGNYGSEILREVSTFKPLGLSPRLLSRDLAAIAGSSADSLNKQHPVTFAAFYEIPWNLFGNLRAGQSQVTTRFPYLDNDVVALAYRLPAELRRSPDPAMQIIRRSDPCLAKIPTDMGLLGQSRLMGGIVKRLLAKITCKLDYFSSDGVPARLSFFDSFTSDIASALRVAGTHKYLRYRNWFRHEVADYVRDAVADVQARQSPFWNQKFLRRMIEDHIAGRKNYVREINAVITLAAAERLLFHGQPTLPDVKEYARQGCGQMSAVVI